MLKKWSKNTFGLERARVLGALVNNVIHQPKYVTVIQFLGLLINVQNYFYFMVK